MTLSDIETLPITITYVGEVRNPFNDSRNVAQWQVTFENNQAIPYFTGLGLRSSAPKPSDNGPAPCRRTLMHARLENQRKPIAPKIAEALNCLLLDGMAFDRGFDDWCTDLGYDSDSRKALAAYDACRANFKIIKANFDKSTIDALRVALEDY